ncbi:MAG TPA: Holliday junction branch migration protein RuvA [Firmicutes bacterium]|nr:Holliday junction branch migration protein RuvA [Bacillota bacterium]
MIASITGKLTYIGTDFAVIDVGGIGFRINLPLRLRQALPAVGVEISLYTHMLVREDDISLYGFGSPEEREFFLLLLSVSGVGPKVALAVVSAMPLSAFRTAVLSEDISALTSISGVGNKLARRLVVELKDKLSRGPGAERETGIFDVGDSGPEGDAIRGLMGLGYTSSEAARAVSEAKSELAGGGRAAGANGGPGDEVLSAEVLIREALKVIARKR